MREAALFALAIALAGCVREEPPARFQHEGFAEELQIMRDTETDCFWTIHSGTMKPMIGADGRQVCPSAGSRTASPAPGKEPLGSDLNPSLSSLPSKLEQPE